MAYSYQYKHDDGRVSYPLCLIFSSPLGEPDAWVPGAQRGAGLRPLASLLALGTGLGAPWLHWWEGAWGSLPNPPGLGQKGLPPPFPLPHVSPPGVLTPFPHAGCKPEQQMMYAGSKNRLVQATQLTKVSGS